MPNPTLDEIIAANESIPRYHVVAKMSSRMTFEGDTNEAQAITHLQMTVKRADKVFIADLYAQEDAVYVESASRGVVRLAEPIRLPHYLSSSINMLKKVPSSSVVKDGTRLRIDCDLEEVPILKDPESYYQSLYERLGSTDEKVVRSAVETVRSLNLSFKAHFFVSQPDLRIEQVTIESFSPKVQSADIVFSDPTDNFEDDIVQRVSKVDPHAPSMPLVAIFMRFPNLGGWSNDTHARWAQQSVSHVRKQDELRENAGLYRQYAELYDPSWWTSNGTTYTYDVTPDGALVTDRPTKEYHPTVIGAWHEDNGCTDDLFPKDIYDDWFNHKALDPHYSYRFNREYYAGYGCRDYNHYGGREDGISNDALGPGFTEVVNDALVDLFHNPKPHLPSGLNNYYSAKNWAYSGDLDDSRNQLTFPEAINQYYCYSFEGKRAAYLILGHCLHLLQDSGNPDHAGLTEHPGSSKSQGWMCDRLCLAFAGLAALVACIVPVCWSWWCPVCMVVAAAAAEALCEPFVDRDALGYEALIRDKWLRDENGKMDWNALQSLEDELSTATVNISDFDEFYARLSRAAIELMHEIAGVGDSPLGCVAFPMLPAMLLYKAYVPNIHAGDYDPYFNLTHKLVLNIIPYGSRFLEYFYEIVNYPPFVEHVLIKSGQKDLQPDGFGKLSNEGTLFTDCAPCKTVYDVRWKQSEFKPERYQVEEVTREMLPPDRAAYIFVSFGPTIPPEDSRTLPPGKSKRVRNLKLSLKGRLPATAQRSIKLEEIADPVRGYYYFGTFTPTNPSENSYEIQLEIEAHDTTAHLGSRAPNYEGYLLDSQPAQIAIVTPDKKLQYAFVEGSYMPGADLCHSIVIAPQLPSSPATWEEPNNTRAKSAHLSYDAETKELAWTLKGLTINTPDDEDWFLIEYWSDPNADAPFMRPDGKCSGGCTGSIAKICTYPPALYMEIEEEFGNCLDANTYDSNGTLLPSDAHHHYQFSAQSRVYCYVGCPNAVLGDAHQMYVRVKSHDFTITGPLRYSMNVFYKKATMKPTSDGAMTIENWIIMQSAALARRWLPMPPLEGIERPEEVETPQLVVTDVPELVSRIEKNADEIVREMGFLDPQERTNAKGDMFLGLGHVARTNGHPEIAEVEFERSSDVYKKAKNVDMQRRALTDLENVYRYEGKIEQADTVAKRIRILTR